ncbi:MAG: TIGR01212 family radical SAM protein [Bacilli bacterium]|nr:TIGR01212 family radical SAM protein [Bacilli bacterium]
MVKFMFKYSLDNKRYHTLNCFYRNKFDSKVFKVSLNAGFGCPNKINGKGCIFCKNGSGNDFRDLDLLSQFYLVMDRIEKKWPNSKHIAYFQADTNTFASVDVLKSKFEQMLSIPSVVGLSIATRCDALDDDVLDYLSELNEKTFLTVEVGLQSSYDKTLSLINRGHTVDDFEKSIKRLQDRNIFTVVHIINGLPYESKDMMINTAKYVNSLGVQGIKIHMLFVSKGTELETLYNVKPFHILSKDEYIDIVCEQLEFLNENMVIMRITGDPLKEDIIEPRWLLKKFVVLNDIDKEMRKRDIFQGDKVK